jgi:Fe(3+) dicitrate transport protein
VGFATTADGRDPVTGQFGPRQVDIDNFRSTTTEARLTHDHRALGARSTLATGVIYSNNDLHRRQQGRGTTGVDYDLTLASGDFGRDIHYRTSNLAFYAENLFRVTARWSVIPGDRLEHGRTRLTGRLAYYDPADLPTSVEHHFPLLGLRSEYRLDDDVEAYGGWSQAYRPMILKDVLPENALERTDPNLRDARGWTLEGGVRGRLGSRITFDVGGFLLRYNDRFGTLLQTDANNTAYIFKTNVGSSLTKGLEVALEAQVLQSGPWSLGLFTATSFYHAAYRKGSVVSGGQNRSIVGNRVEAVPRWISRSGLSAVGGPFSATATVSHVASTFADALNTVTPSANGAIGLVPAYTLLDLGIGASITRWLQIRGGITNALDRQYFTKRPTFYPGPGIWPSDGRAVQLAAELRW